MKDTPKSLRLQIGIFGRTNVGKSSFLNMILGQDFAITSPIPGTTTDVVEKTMELLPIGPVVFLDTAGVDDASILSDKRLSKTKKILDRADVGVIIFEADVWSNFEEAIIKELKTRNIPTIAVINKVDKKPPTQNFISKLEEKLRSVILCSTVLPDKRDKYIEDFKKLLLKNLPDSFLKEKPLIGDIVQKKGLMLLVIPIDFEAPKGRIILPQVQVIRDALDHDICTSIVKESEYVDFLGKIKTPPDLVVCDSQVVDFVVSKTPKNVKCTTFSILFSRHKGDLKTAVESVYVLEKFTKDDRILIAEACNHHPIEGDIGRKKIPFWLKKYLGFSPLIDVVAGRDYPEDLSKYKLVVHCGGCMITQREMLSRIKKCTEMEVPITNYGVIISYLHKVLDRVLEPFRNDLARQK